MGSELAEAVVTGRPDRLESLQRPDLAALLSVSRAVSEGGPLPALLRRIAREAAGVVDAYGASVLMLTRKNALQLAGAYGLSAGYGAFLKGDGPTSISPGRAPSGLAIRDGALVAVEDTETDERVAQWRHIAVAEGYRAMVSAPLLAGSQPLGVLNVYRAAPGPWPEDEITLLSLFSGHAATAIRTAKLLESRQRQLIALERLVTTLRDQGHEHANRIHAIGGLLALGAYEEAQRFVADLATAQSDFRRAIVTRVHNATVAGLILSEMTIANQRGVSLRLDGRSRLRALPPTLGEAEAVTIIGNLLHNAFDAVAEMPQSRRRVKIGFRETARDLVIEVRDWGPGLAPGAESDIFRRGYTSKRAHDGVGLALVSTAAASALGEIRVERRPHGVSFIVTIPKA